MNPHNLHSSIYVTNNSASFVDLYGLSRTEQRKEIELLEIYLKVKESLSPLLVAGRK